MSRRSRAGGKPAKARRRKTATLKRRNVPKAVRRCTSSDATHETEVARLTRELNEALERQNATAEVLGVISRSKFELQPVLQSVLDTATRLCRADQAEIFRLEGGSYRLAAFSGHDIDAAYQQIERRALISPGPGTVVGRAAMNRQVARIEDAWTDRLYEKKEDAKIGGVRSMIGVPLIREGEQIGVIALARRRVEPFVDREIELVTTFADQSMIAIENARLLNELRQRTSELGRLVEELRALGEVSQAVNSTLDLKTVLSTIVAKAVQLSGTEAGAIYVFDDRRREFHLRATYGIDQDLIDALTQRHIGLNDANVAQALTQHEPIQIADLKVQPSSTVNEIILRAGFRALLAALLFRGEDVVGMLVVRRRTPGAFPQNTVDLIKTFAAQSAVAIENARLFQNVETSLEELRTTQDRLVQTQKLASLGQLTAGIAHEIKNPLNFVNNF